MLITEHLVIDESEQPLSFSDSRIEQAITLIHEMLRGGEMPSADIYSRLAEYGISKRIAENAKGKIGMLSVMKGVDGSCRNEKNTPKHRWQENPMGFTCRLWIY